MGERRAQGRPRNKRRRPPRRPIPTNGQEDGQRRAHSDGGEDDDDPSSKWRTKGLGNQRDEREEHEGEDRDRRERAPGLHRGLGRYPCHRGGVYGEATSTLRHLCRRW